MIKEKINLVEIEKIKQLISTNQRFVITTHHNSDGDAMGSATAMAEVLRQMGKDATIVLPNGFPTFFNWMKGTESIVIYDKEMGKGEELISQTDVVICLDFNQLGRIDALEPIVAASTKPRIVIDHHLGLKIENLACVSVPEASSTCELVYHVLNACGYESYINLNVAESLYTGMMTDTGRLDFSSSYTDIYEAVGNLVAKGVRKTFVHDNIYNVYTYNRMKLKAKVLGKNMVFMPEYHTVYMYITMKDKYEFDFQLGDSEGLVNIPLEISDVKLCALFTEYKDHVKVSLRSKGDFSVEEFARTSFNGGGHKNASGGELKTSLQDTIAVFVDGVKKRSKDLQ